MSASYEDASIHDASSLEQLVVEHAELVKRIAYHLLARMPAHVDVNDLIQAGMIGLLNAAENYSATRGANFATYAGIRIRGAMLDEARRASYTPRSTFRHARQVAAAIRETENELGGHARDRDVAEKLGVDIEEYHRMLESAASSRVLSLDELAVGSHDETELVAATEDEPLGQLQDEELRDSLVTAIEGLPERERLVMSLYYEKELNLREIGEVLGVGESRVCQIHGQAVMRIRARLRDWFEDE